MHQVQQTLRCLRPFHDLYYSWSFGDAAGSPVSGTTWAYGSRATTSSRNEGIGPVAAHVFETPGTYTITLYVFDGVSIVSTTQDVVVSDPDVVFAGTNTICIGALADPTPGSGGCPTGADHYQQANFSTAINTYAGTGIRILFNRGDTFSVTASAIINMDGPGIIGAYGTGADPILVMDAASSYPAIQLSSATTPGIGDWRVMDLEFDGNSAMSTDVSAIATSGGFNKFLALRLNIHDIWRGVASVMSILDWWNDHGNPGHTMFDQWSVVDSTITALPGCNSPGNYNCDWRIYLAADRVNIQGNFLDNEDTGGSHVIRSAYMSKGVISNNTITRAGDFQMAIKLHAGGWGVAGVANPGGVGTYSEQVVISDNKIIGGINSWTISLGPQDAGSDERVRDVIVERNWFTAGSASQLHIHINSYETTIRNNVCDLSNTNGLACVSVDQWGITPAPYNVRIYNNTFYSTSSGANVLGVDIGTADSIAVKNNLLSAPNASTPILITGTGTNPDQSNNLMNNTPSALFVNSTPSNPTDFVLTSGSPAIGAGIQVPNWKDFISTTRPNPPAIGAFEQ